MENNLFENNLFSYQINDAGIAITKADSKGSVLLADGECFTYTLTYEEVTNNLDSLEQAIMEAVPTVTHYKKDYSRKPGLYVTEERADLVQIYCQGEKAVLQGGVLRHSRKFSIPVLIAYLNRVYRELPKIPPTYEDPSLRARYIADGNLVIVNSKDNCLVFNKDTLQNSTISSCMIGQHVYEDVSVVPDYTAGRLSLFVNKECLFQIQLDRSVEKYLLQEGRKENR